MSNSENKVLLADGAKSDDELSLSDLVAFVRRHRFASLGGALIGAALGLAVAFTLPVEWEAVALLQLAQIGGAGSVEPPSRVVERVMQGSFREDALSHLDVSRGRANSKKNSSCNIVKAKVEKTDLVSVRVRAGSSDEAVQCVEAMVAQVAIVHTKMAEPTIERWRSELEDIDIELKRGASEFGLVRDTLARPAKTFTVTNLYQMTLASNLLVYRGAQLRDLREHRRALQEQLSPERTFPTAPFGRVEVPKAPVFPKKSLFAAAGLMIGLFMGMSLSVLRHVGTRRSAQSKTD